MSHVRSSDPNPLLRRLASAGDERSSAAHLRRAQHRAQRGDNLNPNPNTNTNTNTNTPLASLASLEEMQSDLQHFSSTIQRLQDHFRTAPQTNVALTRTLESSQAISTALETAHSHLAALRSTLRAPSMSHALSPLLQSSPSSTPTSATRTLSQSTSTGHSLRTGPAIPAIPAMNNGWGEIVSPTPTTGTTGTTGETSPAEERAHYVALTTSNRSVLSGVWAHYNVRSRHAADTNTRDEVRRRSAPQDDALWYSIPPSSSPSSDGPQPSFPPRVNLGRTPRPRLPPTQLDPTTPQQAPQQAPPSVVQFRRQSQPSVQTTSSTSSSSSASSTDTNNDQNSTSAGDGGSAADDDITSVNRAANRLFQRLSSLQETTRRLRERRWSNLPDRGLADSQVLTSADFDPVDPTAPARRPGATNFLRRRVLSTAPPPNGAADAAGEEENKENVGGELVLCHTVWTKS